uniref:Uncharacterized protein n=1 Tax=Desulfatirhabdium butyrativorans TaxID=340467 RepID=A0A7C4MQ33_9BACT
MKKHYGILGVSVMVLLAWASVSFANITLNVNSRSNTNVNKITYTSGTTTKTVTLPWKEKVVYNGGEVGVSVKNAVQGDIVIKVDILSYTDDGAARVDSYWLKYGSPDSPLEPIPVKAVELVKNGQKPTGAMEADPAVDKEDLSTLALEKQVKANTTIPLLSFYTNFNYPGQIIFTAMLIDKVDAEKPQVMGVDIQTILFNGTDDGSGGTAAPIWLKLIQRGN